MNWAFVIFFVLSTLGLGISLGKHGEFKKGKENGWISLIAYLVTMALVLWAIGWSIL